MQRSYEVRLVLGRFIGWSLLCFEGDEMIWQQFYKSSDKAHEIGEKFLTGAFHEGLSYAEDEYISV